MRRHIDTLVNFGKNVAGAGIIAGSAVVAVDGAKDIKNLPATEPATTQTVGEKVEACLDDQTCRDATGKILGGGVGTLAGLGVMATAAISRRKESELADTPHGPYTILVVKPPQLKLGLAPQQQNPSQLTGPVVGDATADLASRRASQSQQQQQ